MTSLNPFLLARNFVPSFLIAVVVTVTVGQVSATIIGINNFSGSEEVITFDPGIGPAYPGSIPSPHVVASLSTNVTFTSLALNSNLGAFGDFNAFAATPGASQGNAFFDRAQWEP